MKALTVCQPYAELIARGDKPIENRTWPTAYRGQLLIHAGKSREWLDDGDLVEYPDMVFGALVARVELYDCVRLDNIPADLVGHEHANGPWCWLMRNPVRPAVPIPCRGAQGLWNWRRAAEPSKRGD
jgi:hypothetical protein